MNSALTPPSEVHPLHRTISRECLVLIVICMLDLATTLYWVQQGYAREGNPLMAWVLSRGHLPFIGVKILTFMPALALCEWHRPRNPVLVTRVLRWAIVLYVFLYLTGIFAHYTHVWHFYRRLLLD